MPLSTERIESLRGKINTLERLISMPVKGVVTVLGILTLSVGLPGIGIMTGVDQASGTASELPVKFIMYSVLLYGVVNIVLWAFLFLWKRAQRDALTSHLLLIGIHIADMYFLSLWLRYAGSELESNLFWIYCLIVVRGVVYFPELITQIVLTASTAFVYAVTYYRAGYDLNNLSFRVLVLVLLSISTYGLYMIYQRRQEMADELRERTIRSQRLNLAGIVAKETAHSLKNPLAIINNAAFLLGRYEKNGGENVRKQIDVISSEVKRADRILGELMNYSTIADGKIDKVDVNKVVDECLEDLRNEIDRRKINVDRRLAPNVPALMIDETQLRQAIWNIILNGCQASDSGTTITVETSTQNDDIRIRISDQGKGIPEEDLRKVFKAFYTTRESGTGLGLSIVHSIIQAYSGKIDVESKVGSGTTFMIVFPTRTEQLLEMEG